MQGEQAQASCNGKNPHVWDRTTLGGSENKDKLQADWQGPTLREDYALLQDDNPGVPLVLYLCQPQMKSTGPNMADETQNKGQEKDQDLFRQSQNQSGPTQWCPKKSHVTQVWPSYPVLVC